MQKGSYFKKIQDLDFIFPAYSTTECLPRNKHRLRLCFLISPYKSMAQALRSFLAPWFSFLLRCQDEHGRVCFSLRPCTKFTRRPYIVMQQTCTRKGKLNLQPPSKTFSLCGAPFLQSGPHVAQFSVFIKMGHRGFKLTIRQVATEGQKMLLVRWFTSFFHTTNNPNSSSTGFSCFSSFFPC